MPSVLNFVPGQETPRLKGTDQIQQCHAWIYQGQHFHQRSPLSHQFRTMRPTCDECACGCTSGMRVPTPHNATRGRRVMAGKWMVAGVKIFFRRCFPFGTWQPHSLRAEWLPIRKTRIQRLRRVREPSRQGRTDRLADREHYGEDRDRRPPRGLGKRRLDQIRDAVGAVNIPPPKRRGGKNHGGQCRAEERYGCAKTHEHARGSECLAGNHRERGRPPPFGASISWLPRSVPRQRSSADSPIGDTIHATTNVM